MRVELYTVPEVGRILKVSRSLAYELVKRGAIRSVRIGPRTVRVRREDLDEFLRERTAAAVEAGGAA
ncbi:MAG TPA: helix-turn-helix domain-containing protein [Actinomycetota bacterium]|nr:helix-turn-helix domain-containing protein [Actinomycetota bacterium]